MTPTRCEKTWYELHDSASLVRYSHTCCLLNLWVMSDLTRHPVSTKCRTAKVSVSVHAWWLSYSLLRWHARLVSAQGSKEDCYARERRAARARDNERQVRYIGASGLWWDEWAAFVDTRTGARTPLPPNSSPLVSNSPLFSGLVCIFAKESMLGVPKHKSRGIRYRLEALVAALSDVLIRCEELQNGDSESYVWTSETTTEALWPGGYLASNCKLWAPE